MTMSRTVYVNGEYLPEEDAKISIFDRGFLMADGVYEVTSVLDGKLADFPGHMERLARSLSELQMDAPLSDEDLLEIHRELVKRNDLIEGVVYLQISRGAADRDFAWPKDVTPSVVMFTQVKDLEESAQAKRGIKVISQPDLRWGGATSRRCNCSIPPSPRCRPRRRVRTTRGWSRTGR